MTDPERAARLWLALAVATLWMVSVGTAVEVDAAAAALTGPVLVGLLPQLGLRVAGRVRRTRLLRLGWLWVLVQTLQGQALPLPTRLLPEPWPALPERLDLPLSLPKRRAYAYM